MKLIISKKVGILTFSTDDSPFITTDTVFELKEVVEKLHDDAELHALVVVGGERTFCAGASRDLLLNQDRSKGAWFAASELPRLLLSVHVPTIAAMAGHAIAGGLLVGLWCDVPILAEESLYGVNVIAIGLCPGMGATTILSETMGEPLAREMLFTGRLLKGREIKSACGPLSRSVVPRHQVMTRALEIAAELAELPKQALVFLKHSISQKRLEQFEKTVASEKSLLERCLATKETRDRIKDHFANFSESGERGKSSP